MKNCQHCGFEFRVNVVTCRPTRTKYLRTGCCDIALRPCPDPVELLRSPNLSTEERQYLQKVAALDWFGGQVATLLIEIEAKIQPSTEVVV